MTDELREEDLNEIDGGTHEKADLHKETKDDSLIRKAENGLDKLGDFFPGALGIHKN